MPRSRAKAIDAATSFAFSAMTIPCGWIGSNSGSYTRRAFGYADEPGRISVPLSVSSSDDQEGCGGTDAEGDRVVVAGEVDVEADEEDAERVQASRIGAATPASAHPTERVRKVRRSTGGCYPSVRVLEATAGLIEDRGGRGSSGEPWSTSIAPRRGGRSHTLRSIAGRLRRPNTRARPRTRARLGS